MISLLDFVKFSIFLIIFQNYLDDKFGPGFFFMKLQFSLIIYN